jgi:hypothetical protein
VLSADGVVAPSVVGVPNTLQWQVGSTDGTWQVGSTTYPPPPFALLQAGDYTPASACVLQVQGVDSAYTVHWSPTNDPGDAGAVELTVTTDDLDLNGDGTITATAARGIVRYGEAGWIWVVMGSDESGLSKTLLPESGKQYVELTSVATSGNRITALPDLAIGDQVIWWNAQPSGDVTVNADGTFVADGTVDTFSVEAHVDGSGYGTAATQDVSNRVDLTADGIVSAPAVDAPTVGQEHGLSATGIASTPSLGTPSVTSIADADALSADGIAAAPSVDSPTFAQVHALSADSIVSASVIDQAQIAQLHALSADGLLADSALGAPLLEELPDALTADGIVAACEAGSPAIGQTHSLTAVSAVSSAVTGAPAIIYVPANGRANRVMWRYAQTMARLEVDTTRVRIE